MPFVAASPEAYDGEVVGDGHCVAYVRAAAAVPHTSEWRQGEVVAGVTPGTAIATFDADGRYHNHTDGSSHAAILVAEEADGLLVWDQWVGRPVAQRLIRWAGGAGCNDAYAYSVIEAEDG